MGKRGLEGTSGRCKFGPGDERIKAVDFSSQRKVDVPKPLGFLGQSALSAQLLLSIKADDKGNNKPLYRLGGDIDVIFGDVSPDGARRPVHHHGREANDRKADEKTMLDCRKKNDDPEWMIGKAGKIACAKKQGLGGLDSKQQYCTADKASQEQACFGTRKFQILRDDIICIGHLV